MVGEEGVETDLAVQVGGPPSAGQIAVAGGPGDAGPAWWRPWLDLMVETVTRGVAVRRARIVSEPVSEYIRYEHSGAFTNVAAGEQVRWNHFSGDGSSMGGRSVRTRPP